MDNVNEMPIEEVVETPVEEKPVEKKKKATKKTADEFYPACHESILSLARGFENIGETLPSSLDGLCNANRINPNFPFKEAALLQLLKHGQLKRA